MVVAAATCWCSDVLSSSRELLGVVLISGKAAQ